MLEIWGGAEDSYSSAPLEFSRQPVTFASDEAKISYVTGLLRGRALDWVESVLGDGGISVFTFVCFMSELKQVFDHPVCAEDTSKRLHNLRQNQRGVADYSVEFRIVAAGSG